MTDSYREYPIIVDALEINYLSSKKEKKERLIFAPPQVLVLIRFFI